MAAKKNSTKKTTARKQAKGAMSQLDAAVQVLAASAEPMSTKQMVEAMAEQKLWTSPAGTLCEPSPGSCNAVSPFPCGFSNFAVATPLASDAGTDLRAPLWHTLGRR